MPNPDQQLIHEIGKGNQEAFEHLFKRYYAGLCIFARKYVVNQEIAEEIIQDLFVTFWEKRLQLELHTSLKSYLFTSAKNRCINYLKHKKIENQYIDYVKHHENQRQATVFEHFSENKLKSTIEQAIENMPEKRRAIFKMSRFEGKKYREIAESLKISVKTVETQMSHALAFLREQLKDFLPLIILFLTLLQFQIRVFDSLIVY